MKRDNPLQNKSFELAILIVRISDELKSQHKAYELATQLIRSGMSVSAMIREAEHAESQKDFLHKLSIALKEVNECRYWMELTIAVSYMNEDRLKPAMDLSEEVLKMLISSVKTTKEKLNKINKPA